jgi:glycosyltransferase involved in cell wall biosynthesis
MYNKPKVSIIVPVYNVEKYFARCMDSLMNQTMKEIEIILVDDGSPDNCPEMCDKYAEKDSRVRVIHKKNDGLGMARNSGLEIAGGDFIAFVDSDDFVNVSMYENLYKIAKEQDYDAVYCGLCFYKDYKNITPRKEVFTFTTFRGRKEVDSFILDMVGPKPAFKTNIKYLMSSCRAIYSRDVINNKGIKFYSEREFVSEDLLFNIDYLTQASAVAYDPSYFYYYCSNEASLTHTWKNKKYDLYVNFLLKVKEKLSSYYSINVYCVHYKRLLFINLIIILRYEYVYAKLNNMPIHEILRKRIYDTFWEELFNDYPFWKLPIKHILLYLLLKHKFVKIVQLVFMMSIIK